MTLEKDFVNKISAMLTMFPLDREIAADLPFRAMVVEGVLPAAVLVFSRSK
jgi:hypothetical protein